MLEGRNFGVFLMSGEGIHEGRDLWKGVKGREVIGRSLVKEREARPHTTSLVGG